MKVSIEVRQIDGEWVLEGRYANGSLVWTLRVNSLDYVASFLKDYGEDR